MFTLRSAPWAAFARLNVTRILPQGKSVFNPYLAIRYLFLPHLAGNAGCNYIFVRFIY